MGTRGQRCNRTGNHWLLPLHSCKIIWGGAAFLQHLAWLTRGADKGLSLRAAESRLAGGGHGQPDLPARGAHSTYRPTEQAPGATLPEARLADQVPDPPVGPGDRAAPGG